MRGCEDGYSFWKVVVYNDVKQLSCMLLIRSDANGRIK